MKNHPQPWIVVVKPFTFMYMEHDHNQQKIVDCGLPKIDYGTLTKKLIFCALWFCMVLYITFRDILTIVGLTSKL